MIQTAYPVYNQSNDPINNEQMNKNYQIDATIKALEMY